MTSDDEKVHILVVDDLPEKVLVLETILEELGQNVVSAGSGRDALRRLLERDFAVILLDVNMPDIDGFETAELIRQRKQTAHTPIIFVTAFGDEIHTARGYSLGAVDYILSPVVPEILRTKVGVFVELYRKSRQVERQAEERVALAREQAARAVAEEATRRSEFLAEASKVLSSSLELEPTVAELTRLLVPALGDLAAVTVVDPVDGSWRTEAAWVDRPNEPCGHITLRGSAFQDELHNSMNRVLDGGAPELLPLLTETRHELPPSLAGATGRVGGARLLAGFDATSAMVLPLRARGRTLGAITLAMGPSCRRYEAADLVLAEDLAGRAAIAIDHARLYRDIQEGDRRKNEFLAMLAHELRNPLAPIRNAVQLLFLKDPADPDLEWARDVIARQVQQMVRMVDDLLDISRITGGKIQLRKERTDVRAIVERAVETSRPLIDARRHSLTVVLPAQALAVDADVARLSQVLANVLNNAAKYTPEGGSIRLVAAREGHEAVFRVRDNGIGIAGEMLPKVFDLFTQVDQSLDRSHGGLGIGLTLVRRLVDLHGGSVQAYSDGPNRGSEFVLRLPAATEAQYRPNSSNGSAPRPARAGDARRILVVDDNADSARSLAKLLRLAGHETEVAHDGPGAIEQAGAFQPDVVLLDIGLPGLNGYDAARAIRQQPGGGDMTLVALTGYGQEADRVRSLEAGFDHHLVKPVDLEMLTNLIGTHRPAPGAEAVSASG